MSAPARRPFERIVRATARLGIAAVVAALAAGLILSWLRAGPALDFILVGLAGLVALPIVNVGEALVEELRRRDWTFAATAFAVLAVLAYNVYRSFN